MIISLSQLPFSAIPTPSGNIEISQYNGQLSQFDDGEIIITTPFNPINAEFIAKLPSNINYIASIGVGTDHIDLVAAKKHNIVVTNTPVLKDDTADFTFLLILASARHLITNAEFVSSGQWTPDNMTGIIGDAVHHQTLGIIGADAVAQKVAKRAAGFDMKVLYHDPLNSSQAKGQANNELDKVGAIYCRSIDELLSESDYISLHCPLNKQTQHIINQQTLNMMKPSATLINVARGALIDEQALVDALKTGVIRAAGLDVHPNEPHINEELLKLDNTLLTPHVSANTQACRQDMVKTMFNNVSHYLNKEFDQMTMVNE
ncbi:2-hydroxyacid dehydrogenase [Colwellia sp. MEBiC06753]